MALDLLSNNNKIRVICFYVTNAGDSAARLARIRDTCAAIDFYCTVDAPIVLVGDFNLPRINWSVPVPNDSTTKESVFADCCDDNGLLQLISFPTHKAGATLDLLFSTDPDIIGNLAPVDLPVDSDHKAISFDMALENTDFSSDCIRLSYKKMDEVNIAAHLNAID